MHYHIYNTPGFVLNALPSGESSQYVFVFTRDLGLVGAKAQNTRHISSKLRYALNFPAKSNVSLVRGKSTWRLVSAVPDKQFYHQFKSEPEKLRVCVQTFSLVKKILAGEEANQDLFDLLDGFLIFLSENDLSSEQLKNLEAVMIVRLLRLTGYLPDDPLVRELINDTDWRPETIANVSENRKGIIKIINESLRATGLS